jgi:hypothetical protein
VHNAEAIAAWQQACPTKTIIPIPCQSIVTSAGVMHCICMHIPAHRGGVNPTVYVQTQNDGATYDPYQSVPISWITDDDASVSNVSIDFSIDGGASWQSVIQETADDGYYIWEIPDLSTISGVIRIIAVDFDENHGEDESDTYFVINGTSVTGDANGDGLVNVSDILAVVDAWGPCESTCPADLDGDLQVNVVDLLLVIASW